MRSDELYKELERGDADYDSRLVFFLLFFSCCIELLRLRYARLAKTYIDSTCFEICCLQAHLECILHAWRSHSADNSRTTQFDRLHEVVELVNPSCPNGKASEEWIVLLACWKVGSLCIHVPRILLRRICLAVSHTLEQTDRWSSMSN